MGNESGLEWFGKNVWKRRQIVCILTGEVGRGGGKISTYLQLKLRLLPTPRFPIDLVNL